MGYSDLISRLLFDSNQKYIMRMNSIILMLVCSLFSLTVYSQNHKVSVGEKSPELIFENLINASQPNMRLSQLKGKIVIIEFWASWCSPCLQAMSYLNQLQKEFPSQIKVVGVNNYDNQSMIQRLSKQRGWALLLASDTAKKLNQIYPHHIIPHTVVIDGQGNVAAITSADQISDSVILRLITNKSIVLKNKDDHVGETSVEKLLERFEHTDMSKPVFNLQNNIPEFNGSYSQAGNGKFSQRRITFINVYPSILFNYAYDWSHSRTIDKTNTANFLFPAGTYCLDVILPNPSEGELKKFMKSQLAGALNISEKFETRKMRVAVIKKSDSVAITLNQHSLTDSIFVKRRNRFHAQGIRIDQFIKEFLDEWLILGVPCINETGLNEKYDIEFDYTIGVKGALQQAFKRIGLQYAIEEREVVVMVLEKND